MKNLNILILPSIDGQQYTTVLAYPGNWTQQTADKNAIAAITAAQTKNPEEWCWDDLEVEFESVGFTPINWHRCPQPWDEQVVECAA